MDRHDRPYRCQQVGCDAPPFGDIGGLFRHRREVHKMRDGDRPLSEHFCPISTCERHTRGFPRRWNLLEHQRRIHGVTRNSSIVEGERPRARIRARRRRRMAHVSATSVASDAHRPTPSLSPRTSEHQRSIYSQSPNGHMEYQHDDDSHARSMYSLGNLRPANEFQLGGSDDRSIGGGGDDGGSSMGAARSIGYARHIPHSGGITRSNGMRGRSSSSSGSDTVTDARQAASVNGGGSASADVGRSGGSGVGAGGGSAAASLTAGGPVVGFDGKLPARGGGSSSSFSGSIICGGSAIDGERVIGDLQFKLARLQQRRAAVDAERARLDEEREKLERDISAVERILGMYIDGEP